MKGSSNLEALLPSRQTPSQPGRGVPPVQLAVRVPSELRDAARSTAESRGMTLTSFVIASISAEVARASDPAAQFSEQVAANIRRRVTKALDDGSWDEAIRAFAAIDKDLAS